MGCVNESRTASNARGLPLGGFLVASIAAVLVLAWSSVPAKSCSIFSLHKSDELVYGGNLDWEDPVPGCVLVNKRDVRKEILPWKGWWPDTPRSETVSWVSRYGSITFTCFGRDFVEGGMNEKGLTVDQTNLGAVYPPDDGRPGVSCSQWIQYQLDNYATVDEVLSRLDDLRPDGEGWHYLISDGTGESAVIEYANGEPVVFTRDDLGASALTNTTYRQAMSHISMDMAFGGDVDIATASDSYGRFVRMAAMMRDYDPARDGRGDEYAFQILDAVSCDMTLRSVVYDASRGRVTWKTPANDEPRWLDFKHLDVSLETPTQMIDIEAGGPGDVSGLLEDYTLEKNRAVVEAVRRDARNDPVILKNLKSRGLTMDEALERIATNPNDSSPQP